MAERFHDIEITYYGTGVGLGSVFLEDGTRVDVRKDPGCNYWVAFIPVHILVRVAKAKSMHPSAGVWQGRFQVQAETPSEAVEIMSRIYEETR